MNEYTSDIDPASSEKNKLTRRDFVAKAGLAAAAFGVAGTIPALAASCGGSSSSSSSGASPGKGSTTPIRFVFAPDPVWNWLESQGIVSQMEQQSGFQIARNETEDEFAFFAGGHADIVSCGSYETPILEKETGVKTVTIGKYNMAKDIIVVAPDKPWTKLGDLPKGSKVSFESLTLSPMIWVAIAKTQEGRTLSVQPGDLQMVIADFAAAPELVLKGDLAAGSTAYLNSVQYLMEGKVKPLYDGMSASQLYSEYIMPGHQGVMSNNFVCTKDYYDAHPKEVAFFLSVWQRGCDEWFANMPAIVKANPEDFGWTNNAEYDWVLNWFKTHFNEWVQSVYMDEKWIKGEEGVTQMLRDSGIIPAAQPSPFYVCIDPKTGTQTASIPTGA